MNDPYNYEGINSGASFDGDTFIPTLDHKRLTGQLKRVFDVMSDGLWHRLSELSGQCAAPEASVGARIRDMRKTRFGSHTVDAKRHNSIKGLWLYRLQVEPQRELAL